MVALVAPVSVLDPVDFDRTALEERVQVLYVRLNDGYRQIAEAEAAGENVTHWESVWRKLLREYEQTYDRLLALG